MVITLIGYRGCGKSTVAPLLAEQLNLDWVDSDQLVEDRAGRTIADIFATDGEESFRDLESEVLTELSERRNIVIAAGGGAILRENNRNLIRQSGPVVWLQASAETLANRIGGDPASGNNRPSLTGKSIQDEVTEVLNARMPAYTEAATLIVDAEDLTPKEIVDQISAALEPNLQEGFQQ